MVDSAPRPDWLARWTPPVVLMVAIYAFSAIPATDLPSLPGLTDLLVKKGGHLLAYAVLASLYRRGIGSEGRRAAGLAFGMALVYALTDEWHQTFVPGRGASLVDVGIDAIGAALGLWVVSPRLGPQ